MLYSMLSQDPSATPYLDMHNFSFSCVDHVHLTRDNYLHIVNATIHPLGTIYLGPKLNHGHGWYGGAFWSFSEGLALSIPNNSSTAWCHPNGEREWSHEHSCNGLAGRCGETH